MAAATWCYRGDPEEEQPALLGEEGAGLGEEASSAGARLTACFSARSDVL